MRVSAAAAAGLLLLGACRTVPTTPAVRSWERAIESVPATAPEPQPAATEQPPRPVAASVQDLRIPSERSCLLEAPVLDHAVLRLAPDGVDFARVGNVTDARVHVTADPVGTGLFVELDKGPVALAGITPARNMEIYAKRSITLGGFYLPHGHTGLRIAGATKGRVLLEVSRQPFDVRDPATMLGADVPCETASLLATRMDARASLGKAIGKGHLLGEAVPLSLTANGEAVATLVPGPPAAEVLERAEGATRIVWRVEGGYVSGWVPAARLGPKPNGGERGSGRLGGRHKSATRVREQRVCSHDVALGVKLGQEARFAGRIRAGAAIAILGSESDLSVVSIAAAEVQLLNGAYLFARTADIAGCAEAPPGSQPWRARRTARGR